MSLTFGSLFAGIGGFDLGFERAGMRCAWQVENDPFCQKVLAKHWPDVGRWDDVRTFPPPPTEDWKVDVICGGFPCQNVSNAGRREGIDGPQSGLWAEFHRIICELRPHFVVVENVPGLLVRGIDRVLGDLAASGCDAEWQVLPACAFGAPHLRQRVWIIAYPERAGLEGQGIQKRVFTDAPVGEVRGERVSESDALRSRNDVPEFVDRIRALGNAVVPSAAEWIGRRLLEAIA